MSIEVNDESGEGIDAERVAALARFVLDRLRVHPQAELSVLAVDVATMSSLHQQWMDEDGPIRERRYQLFVENTVQDYITEGKDVRKLFEPGAPDKLNPEYLGNRAILDEFGKGAKQFGKGQANTVFPAEGELKDNPSIMKAYKEGRFGTFGTQEAIEAAKQYSIRAGLGMRRQVVPESGVPMR